MKWKIISLTALAVILVLVAVWIKHGSTIYTKEQRQVVTKVKDEIFGTETEKVEWVDDFQLGLLPGTDEISPKIFQSVAVPSGFLIVIAIGSLYLDRRSKPTNKA